MKISVLARIIRINLILAKHGLDEIILSIPFLAPFRFIAYLNPWNWRHKKGDRGQMIRSTLEQLGPIFVKFGQTLSLRGDFLPEDIIEELSKLQDKVVPFPGEIAQHAIEMELGQPIHQIFQQFDLVPLASASIAQVHAATLLNGQAVVIKVLRPQIEKHIRQDLEVLYAFARLLDKHWPAAKRFHPVEMVAEFERHLLGELDLQREAANASQLKRNFAGYPYLYIPEIYWDYTSRNIMVQERIYGIPISDMQALKQHQVNLKKLAERGVEIFFTQVFRDCFFHADMHPGNLFINPANPNDPQYIAVDFGIIGTLNNRDQRYLAENFLAFFRRDYQRVAELHLESGWVPSDVHPAEFAQAMRAVCEPIFEKPLKDISFGKMLLRLLQTAREYRMNIQPQLILLQKTLMNIESLGRRLYPELDLWKTARPFMENWMQQRYSPKKLIKNIYARLPDYIEKFPEMPGLIHESLQCYIQTQRQPKNFVSEPQDHSSASSLQSSGTSSSAAGFFLVIISLTEAYYLSHHEMYLWQNAALVTLTGLIGFILMRPRKGTS